MALSAHSIPVIVAEAVLKALEKRLVFSQLFNKNYEGEVSYGSAVKITSIGAINVKPYSRYTEIDWQQVEDDSITLNIDQAEYVSILIDDLDKVQARPDIMASYIKQAVEDLKDVVDQYLANLLMTQADPLTDGLGDDGLPLDIDESNVTDLLTHMARLLDDAKIPRENRVCVFPPWFLEKLTKAAIVEITENKNIAENGWVGRYAGFNLLLSNNTPSSDTADEGGAGTADKIIAGSPISGTFAVQLEKTELIRLQDYFGDGWRALTAYGAKVTRPDTICVATCDEAIET